MSTPRRTTGLKPGSYSLMLRAAVKAGYAFTGCTVPYVHDGDTIDANVATTLTGPFGLALTCSYRVRLRLARINAPALGSPDGDASQAWLAGQLMPAAGAPLVSVTTLDAYKYGGPSYSPGDWMAEIVLPDGQNLSDLSVATGHAVYWDGQGPRPDDGGAS